MSAKRRGKRVICFCMVMLLLLQLCACANAQKPMDDAAAVSAAKVSAEAGSSEMPEAYTEVLDAYAKLLLGTGEITEMTGPVGINSAIDLLSALDGVSMAAEAPYRCGYLLKDINKDGVPELLIGEISNRSKRMPSRRRFCSGSIKKSFSGTKIAVLNSSTPRTSL